MAFMDTIGNIQHLQELRAENAANKAKRKLHEATRFSTQFEPPMGWTKTMLEEEAQRLLPYARSFFSPSSESAHDIIDSLIAANDMSSPSGSARDLGNTLLGHLLQGSTPVPVEEGITGGDFENGVSEETHLQVLDQHGQRRADQNPHYRHRCERQVPWSRKRAAVAWIRCECVCHL